MRALEGTVTGRSANSARVLSVAHGAYTSQLVLDEARLDLAEELEVGTRIRVVDAIVDGTPPLGRYRLADRSEVCSVA